MKSKEDIRSISYVKTHAADILMQVNETQRPIYVTQNGETRAVMIDPESYHKMKTALGLLKLTAQGEKDLADGRITEQDQFFAELERKMVSLRDE